MWDQEWLVVTEDGTRMVPAFEWLKDQPLNVRKQLLAIVQAVRSMGPDQWKDRSSHTPMKSDLDRVHEARDKHGETLYRLFLRWQRTEERVILLDGRTKANNTVISDTEYAKIEALADLADQDPAPLAVADDFAQAILTEGD